MHSDAKSTRRRDLRLQLALNRAMLTQDAEQTFSLLSDWMKGNSITLPENYRVPKYLAEQFRQSGRC